MLACTALVGCTNNDEPVNNGNENNGKKDNAYMAINIKVASDAGSRAITDEGYVAGTDDENTITAANSIFLFYDAAGKWVTSGVVTGATPDENHSSTADHEGQVNDVHGDAYVVLQATQEQLQNIAQVLTVINYSGCDALKRLNKDEALAKVTSTATDPANGLNPGFLMTTSTYYDSGIVNTTAVTSDNIKDSPEAANLAPVDIYIERAAAKVEVAADEDPYRVTPEEGNADDKNIVVDGVLTPVYITIDGWTLNGVVENTYLSKQLIVDWGTEATEPFAGWNWAENHRSYWAKSTNWESDETKTYYAYEDATNEPGDTPAYCYENTVNNYSLSWEAGEENHKITTVLLKAHFQTENAEGELNDAQNYYRYSGVYYSEDEYKTLILKQLQGVYAKVTTTTEGSTEKADLTTGDITLGIESNGSMAGVQFTVTLSAEGVERVDGTNETVTAETIAAFINALPYVKTAEGFLDGACYYQVPIEHLHAALNENNVLTGVGVVRNHWYKLSIDAVRNIGEAVYNPEKDITDIPAEVEDYYLSVQLHVLSWHVVNQGVTLK